MLHFQVVLHSHINMYKHQKTMIGIIIQTIHKVVVAVINKVQHLHHNKYNKIILIVIKVIMKQQ
jgi:hypothetical protein